MAIYHLRAKVVQRSAGQSAVKSASYRHGERLYDERLERYFSYRKPEVVHSAILAPDGAPEWVYAREELWNRAERAETRKNAQPAREIEISLPVELTAEQRVEVVHHFCQEQFVARGMTADVAIHVPLDAMGRPQPHAHIMLSMRRLDGTTETGFAKTKARDWNERPEIETALREAKDAFRQNETPELAQRIDALDGERNINVWRRTWADSANDALAQAGQAARIDHRTLKAQGIDREPQTHLGLARHIENAYDYVKDRVSNWLAVLKRNELYRAFAPYRARNPATFSQSISAIAAFTDQFMDHWRQRPRDHNPPTQENSYDA
jgi:ATP-dependent exoDNAse (exonuclease V) alpha subunit